MRYWGFGIDVHCRDYPDFYERELKNGFLRQGWGSRPSSNLKHFDSENPPREQLANLRMFSQVKRDDIVLVPYLPNRDSVTVVRATADWDEGYVFEIDPDLQDYGHKFPVEEVTRFDRRSQHVRGDLRRALGYPWRFWDMGDCAESVDELLQRSPVQPTSTSGGEEGSREPASTLVMRALNEYIGQGIHQILLQELEGSDWENLLFVGLKALFPNYGVERTCGVAKEKRVTDMLVTIPGPLGTVRYGIAIQVRDWRDTAFNIGDAVVQVRRAVEDWRVSRPELRIIDTIMVVTGADIPVTRETELEGVTIVTPSELNHLLRRMAVAMATAMDE